jgi:hypothetical protein
MLQMSRPVQLLLLCTAAFAAAWFMFLRPKPITAPATAQTTAAPGQVPGKTGPTGGAAGTGDANTTLGKSVDKAVAGANTAGQDAGRAAGADPGTTSTPTPSTPGTTPSTATPSTAPPTTGNPDPGVTKATKGLPAPVAKALDANKVIVLLFWNPESADDSAVRRELRQVKRRGNKVYIAAAPISQLARFSDITRGVEVLQSPTVVVVDPSRKASKITGYTDATEIDQAVTDALAAPKS